jgi:hypothetical protein
VKYFKKERDFARHDLIDGLILQDTHTLSMNEIGATL